MLIAGVVWLSIAAGPLLADPRPLPKEEQAQVDAAIEKGIRFLKHTQLRQGDWPRSMAASDLLGQVLLPAYALLESGVPAEDPAIQRAANYIRPRAVAAVGTYQLSLAMLFLDRLNDPKDKSLIRSLSLRLIAGQHWTGGWHYRCPTLTKQQEEALFSAAEAIGKRQEAGEKAITQLLRGLDVPHSLRRLAIFCDPARLPWSDPPRSTDTQYKVMSVGSTDNSNTQFAMLGLWAAQRHGIPVGPTFRLLVERFERTQDGQGCWPYLFDRNMDRAARPSMTCVGLLGLAIGRGLKLSTPGAPREGAADLRVLGGLAAVSRDIGVVTAGQDTTYVHRGLYYLWSVERVAMLYNLQTIGDKDWYRWGVKILLPAQRENGMWKGGKLTASDFNTGYGPTLDTSFALLFLKHSHPMKDLTPKLPFKPKELNEGILQLLRDGKSPSLPITSPGKAGDLQETPTRPRSKGNADRSSPPSDRR